MLIYTHIYIDIYIHKHSKYAVSTDAVLDMYKNSPCMCIHAYIYAHIHIHIHIQTFIICSQHRCCIRHVYECIWSHAAGRKRQGTWKGSSHVHARVCVCAYVHPCMYLCVYDNGIVALMIGYKNIYSAMRPAERGLEAQKVAYTHMYVCGCVRMYNHECRRCGGARAV